MSVAIVTINWNGWRLTRRCVAAAQRSSLRERQIYIVDNASTDDSLERLAEIGDAATLIAHPLNAGWAGGNNVGLERALADGHEFVLLLNNDALLAPRALELLVRAHAAVTASGATQAPVLGAVERRTRGGFGFVRATMNARTGIPGWHPGEDPMEQPALIPTAFVQGAALFAHRSVFEQVGPFDERFFLCYDETDWCLRARRAGHPLLVVRDARIVHDGSASMGKADKPLSIYFMVRNRLLFAEKHCTPTQQRAVEALHQREGRIYESHGGALFLAARQADLDYRERRFGDCPPMIRALHARVRRAAAQRAAKKEAVAP